MKKLLYPVISVILVICCLFSQIIFAGAAEESSAPTLLTAEDFEYTLLPADSPTKVTLKKYIGSATNIQIPSKIEGLPVTVIASGTFSGNESITRVSLPSSVTTIAGNAFNGCTSVTEYEFKENNYYTTIDGVLYGKSTVGPRRVATTLVAYPGAREGDFTVPYGITTIGHSAFYACHGLTNVVMYNTVTKIDAYAFQFCTNLESIRISDNLRQLGSLSLAYCPKLREVFLPATITFIGKDALLADINSLDQKYYYFTKGVHCTPDTYAHYYLLNQGIPTDVIKLDYRSVSHVGTGIELIDTKNMLEHLSNYDIVVEPASTEELSYLFPIRYKEAFAFKVSLQVEAKVSEVINSNKYTYNKFVDFTPTDRFILNFDSAVNGAIPCATKVYLQNDNTLIPVNGNPATPFVGTQVDSAGTFVILANDDFSLSGDLDGDGKITLSDVRIALYYTILGAPELTAEQLICANVHQSENEDITTEDARKILRIAAGIE